MVKITKSASIDRSIDRPFSSVFLSSSRSFAIISSRWCCCSFRPRRDKPRKTHVLFDACFHFDFETRDRVSEICFSLLSLLTSRRFLSLSLEQHSMLHRRRVRRGPDHGHDRAEVPAHRGKQRASLKVVFARFIMTSSICIRLQNARVQNVRVRHTTGPRRRHFFDALDAIAEEERARRTIGRVGGGLLSPFFVGSGVLTLSLSLSRECNTNLSLSSLKCTNLFFLLRTKRSPWSI